LGFKPYKNAKAEVEKAVTKYHNALLRFGVELSYQIDPKLGGIVGRLDDLHKSVQTIPAEVSGKVETALALFKATLREAEGPSDILRAMSFAGNIVL
jgi:hypothetical protein